MLAILNSLNAHNLPILLPILMILVSKFMVHRALSDKTYLSLGLLSPLTGHFQSFFIYFFRPFDPKSEKNSRKSTNKKILASQCSYMETLIKQLG